jgi:hypothetical protein
MSINEIREQILSHLKARYAKKDPNVKPGPKGFIGAGQITTCPNCGQESLHYSRATNGHVVAWME